MHKHKNRGNIASGKKKAVPHVQPRLSVVSYAKRVFESIDTPVSLSLALLLKYGEHQQLVRKSIESRDYNCPLAFFLDYQAVKLLSKGVGLKTDIDTKRVALVKFLSCEDNCRKTNSRFRSPSSGFNNQTSRVFSNMQRKISWILGDLPNYERLDFHFGPGASYGVRGDTSVYNKVSSPLECTPAMVDILPAFLEEFPAWIGQGLKDINLVSGSQLIVVPKNAKTDRPICIEPLLNGFAQGGYGSYIRSRLSRWGIDLRNQGVNQRLASKAFSDRLATVDFSSASDTISYNLVLDLLPIDWFEALDVLRCPSYEIEGNWYDFHKFTSMGNAYTFELETLIFFALAISVCEELDIPYSVGENLSVYGDDVIIPQDAFHLFSEVSSSLGFTVNEEKSFSEGSFFESCGHDYFAGILVRPFILSKEPNKLDIAFYYANTIKRIHNRIKEISRAKSSFDFSTVFRRQFDGYDSTTFCTNAFISSYTWVVGCISPFHRIIGPDGYGDGHLISKNPKRDPRSFVSGSDTWDGWWFETYTAKAVRVDLIDCPLGYALYFNRVQPMKFKPHWVLDTPEPLDNGLGYSVRGNTRLVRQKVFCHFVWQDMTW